MVGISPSSDEEGDQIRRVLKYSKEGVKIYFADTKRVKMGHFAFGAFFLTLYMLGIYIWVGIFLNNMDFSDRYTRLLPFAGSSFRNTARYGWEWGFIYAMFFMNIIMGYLLATSICNNSHPLWAKTHKWWSGLTLFANCVFFIVLSIMWLFVCNTGYSQGSPCNSAQWCCNHYLDKPEWCQNGIACAGTVDTRRSDEFLVTWIYSILLIVIAWAHRSVHMHLWSVGMFMEEEIDIEIEKPDDTELELVFNKKKEGLKK